MTNLIRVEVDTSELEAKLEDLEVLEAKVEELTNQLANIEVVHTSEGEDTEGADMLAKFMTRDEIEEFIKEILRDAPISIDV